MTSSHDDSGDDIQLKNYKFVYSNFPVLAFFAILYREFEHIFRINFKKIDSIFKSFIDIDPRKEMPFCHFKINFDI